MGEAGLPHVGKQHGQPHPFPFNKRPRAYGAKDGIMIYEDEFVPAIEFWPEDDVRAAFTEADKAIGTEEEAVALRVFYQRMKFHLKTSATINSSPDMEERMIEHYERPRLDAEVARIEGRPPVPCAGCPFTECNHKGGA